MKRLQINFILASWLTCELIKPYWEPSGGVTITECSVAAFIFIYASLNCIAVKYFEYKNARQDRHLSRAHIKNYIVNLPQEEEKVND